MGEGQREREREGGRERIPNRLHTVSTEPNRGLHPMNVEITLEITLEITTELKSKAGCSIN